MPDPDPPQDGDGHPVITALAITAIVVWALVAALTLIIACGGPRLRDQHETPR